MTMMTMKQCGEVRKRRAVAAKTWVSTTKQCQGSWLGREVGEGKRCWHMEQSTVACSRSSTAILLRNISFFKLPSRTIPCKCAQNGNTKSCKFPKKALSLYYLSHIWGKQCRLQTIIPKLIFKLLDIAVWLFKNYHENYKCGIGWTCFKVQNKL